MLFLWNIFVKYASDLCQYIFTMGWNEAKKFSFHPGSLVTPIFFNLDWNWKFHSWAKFHVWWCSWIKWRVLHRKNKHRWKKFFDWEAKVITKPEYLEELEQVEEGKKNKTPSVAVKWTGLLKWTPKSSTIKTPNIYFELFHQYCWFVWTLKCSWRFY